MTKKELEQLIDLKKEIEELEQKILKIEQMDISGTSIKVKTSMKNFPYIQSGATVHGYDPILADKRARLLYEKKVLLDQRREDAETEEKRLLQYINSVEESRVRRIMQFRYIEGLTWETIGNIINCDRTTAEKIVSRYLKKNEK